MKGKILDFSISEGQGIISGDDNNRYTFAGKEWKSRLHPQAGKRVDFDADGRNAIAVYLDELTSESGDASQSGQVKNDGYYRSSNNKALSGVCAGLADKWNVSTSGLRVATFLVTIFTFIPLLAYIVCWIIFPEQQTRSSKRK